MTNRSRLTRDVNHIKRDIFDVARDPRILCENKVFDDGLKPTVSMYDFDEKYAVSNINLISIPVHSFCGSAVITLLWRKSPTRHYL